MDGMRSIPFILCVGLIGLSSVTGAQAPDTPAGPDPREIPLPPIATKMGTLPGVKELPVRAAMPDVMVMNDGTKVASRRQWQQRREEMRRILSYYAVGEMPPAPGNVKGREVHSELVLDGTVRYRLIRLTFGPKEQLGLDIGVFTPAERRALSGRDPSGRHASRRNGASASAAGSQPGTRRKRVCSWWDQLPRPHRHQMQRAVGAVQPLHLQPHRWQHSARRCSVVAMRWCCSTRTTAPKTQRFGTWTAAGRSATRVFFRRIPAMTGEFSAGWAWGASRVADYLEQDASIDKSKLIITGASRNGKAAMIAAAFDDRLMGAPVVTGGGGMGAYRFAGPRGSETLDIMQLKYPNWFSPNLRQFRGQREKLPFDQHWFLALAAPRPFIALEGDTDRISLPEAVRQSILGAKPAYALFGAADRLGVNYAHHGHAFTADDWTAMLDFFDMHLRGKRIERTFDRFPTEAELDAAAAQP